MANENMLQIAKQAISTAKSKGAQEAAAATLLPLTKAQAHSEKTATYAAAKDAAGNLSFVERHGRDLLYVVGAPPALAPKLRAEAWAKWSAVR